MQTISSYVWTVRAAFYNISNCSLICMKIFVLTRYGSKYVESPEALIAKAALLRRFLNLVGAVECAGKIYPEVYSLEY